MGTCSVNKVVDNTLTVIGFTGLRVADASVIPNSFSGNTNAPCIMIAENLADIIANKYKMKRANKLEHFINSFRF